MPNFTILSEAKALLSTIKRLGIDASVVSETHGEYTVQVASKSDAKELADELDALGFQWELA